MTPLLLTPFSSDSTAELVVSMLGAAGDWARVLDLLQRETEGNALFLVETVRTLAEEAGRLQEVASMALPETIFSGGVQRVIRRRLARVPKSHRPLLKLAAVAGRNLDLALLQAVHPDAHLETWLVDCANVATLQAREGSWRFVHDKLRTELLEGLDDAERPRLHRQVAEAYEQVHPGDPGCAAALVAHWEAASEGDGGASLAKAARYARIAGEYAAAQYAGDDAVRFLSKALALTPEAEAAERYGLYLAREQVYGLQGERQAQAADLAQLRAMAQSPAQRCEIALRTSAYYIHVAEYAAALAASEQAQQWALACDDRAGQAQALIHAGQALIQQGEYEPARQRHQHAAELAAAAGAPIQLARARSGLGEIARRQGDYPTAMRHHQEALRLQQKMASLPEQVQSLRRLGQATNAQGNYATARSHYLAALELARQMGDRPQEGQILFDLAEIDWRQGAYQQAMTSLEQSLALARKCGDRYTAAAVLNGMGVVVLQQGSLDQAIAYWQQSLALRDALGDRAGVSKTLNNLGNVARRQRKYDQARRYYEQSLAIKQEIGDRAGVGQTLQNLGVVAYDLGQYDRASEYYQRSLAIARQISDRAAEALMLTNLGRVVWRQGQHDSSINYHEQSLGIARELGDRSEEGIVLNRLGAVALFRSEYQQADSYYRQALAIRQELGQAHYQVEDWAGLALAALRQGDPDTARAWVEQLLAAWAGNPTFEKADEPMRTLYFAWQVCQELELAQAYDILVKAAEVLQVFLDNHPDQETQSVYLQQQYHRELWAAWLACKAPGQLRHTSPE